MTTSCGALPVTQRQHRVERNRRQHRVEHRRRRQHRLEHGADDNIVWSTSTAAEQVLWASSEIRLRAETFHPESDRRELESRSSGCLLRFARQHVMPQPSLLARRPGTRRLGSALSRTPRVSSRFGQIQGRQKRAEQLAELHLATIEALARAIDAKDGTAENHIRRVQLYAAAVAGELGMSETDIQAVRAAAAARHRQTRGAPEHILSKPGPLTAEEFQKVQAHPQVGADIIAACAFPYPVATLIQNHHERWDGRGYPRGLKGEDIPLGARFSSWWTTSTH